MLVQILNRRFQQGQSRLCPVEDIPEDLQALFSPTVMKLEAMGFCVSHAQLSRHIIRHSRDQSWSLVMFHRDSHVFAEISFATVVSKMPGASVEFFSFASDSQILCTVNSHYATLYENTPELEINEAYAASVQDEYQYHLDRLKDWAGNHSVITPDPTGFTEFKQKFNTGYFANMVARKVLIPLADDTYRLSLKTALAFPGVLAKGNRRSRQIMAQQAKAMDNAGEAADAQTELPLAAEVRAYQYVASVNENRTSGILGRSVAFVLTLIASYFMFGLVLSYHTVIILLAVILIHELGHFLAMYAFRYRDLQILFIPMLGGIALGKKADVAVWKQVVVYLMGPLPGIVLGLVLLGIHNTALPVWTSSLAYMLLIINYLNLLPMLPLDGGHIIRLTIMQRFPRAQSIFTILSGLAFLLAAHLSKDSIFLILAFVMFFSLIMSVHRRDVLKLLAADTAIPDKRSFENKLTQVFSILRKPQFKRLSFLQKYRLVKSLKDTLQQRPCGVGVCVGMLAIYLAVLLITPAVAVLSIYGSHTDEVLNAWLDTHPQGINWGKEFARAKTPKERLLTDLNAAYYYAAEKDHAKAKAYLLEAEKIAKQLKQPEYQARVKDAYATYYETRGETAKYRMQLQQAIQLRLSAPQRNYIGLSNNYKQLARYYFARHDLLGYETELKTALQYAYQVTGMLGLMSKKMNQVQLIRDELQDFYYVQHQPDKAERLLLADLDDLKSDKSYMAELTRQKTFEDLGWLALEQDKPEVAVMRFNQSLAAIGQHTERAPTRETLKQNQAIVPNLDIAYAYYKQGKLQTARHYLDKTQQLVENAYHTTLDEYLSEMRGADGTDASLDSPRLTAHWRVLHQFSHKLDKKAQ